MQICQLCKMRKAEVDGKTKIGYWCYMCDWCHISFGVGFGVGKGQTIKPDSISHKVESDEEENL